MKAITLKQFGSAAMLQLGELPIPEPKPDEVLIRVCAAGVNRPDILQRQGLYPAPADASPILGLEVAGEIVACGDNVFDWRRGDKVCALVNGGGYAEYAVAPAAQCLAIPKDFSYLEAAALPEAFFTVWSNLWQRANIKAGDSLLVHGGTSGIGTTAIQLAIAFGIQVYATAGSPAKCQAIAALGAVAINYRERDFAEEIKFLTQGRGVDVILDMVGDDYIQKNMAVAAKDGRIVSIAFLNGSRANLDLMPLMLKRLTLTGSTLRAQAPQAKAAIAQELKHYVWPVLTMAQENVPKIKPIIDSVYPLAEVGKAHERMESSQHIGKIILRVA